jgi:hypothetical protein
MRLTATGVQGGTLGGRDVKGYVITCCHAPFEYEYEYRCAEYEYEEGSAGERALLMALLNDLLRVSVRDLFPAWLGWMKAALFCLV